MRNFALALLCLAGLSACGAHAFKPQEYPLRAGLIPSFLSAGTVTVGSTQSNAEPVVVSSYAGISLTSSLKDITDVMVQQTREEIGKNGQISPGSPKTLSIKVDSLVSKYIAFYYKSTIEFEVTLGNGETIKETVHHASGELPQDLDGCIAEGVMVMLNDSRIRTYLAG
ncbi:hypothetical protein IHE49_05500 [Rhodanobacter sp. 7MK24]|uniref:hypothetical protein n=1 Tax=Rhodanobacter sp. 7MK24 TaxID=2775922 RepID=UPI0017847AED|nr:hypothetical protein [Rhodanobacter sp. 7MK24]MBD8879929.1 hypothetical protein [Rhodanobacter sp. 7MK24]